MAGRFDAFGLFAFKQVFRIVGFDLDEDPRRQTNAFHDACLDETQFHERRAFVGAGGLNMLLRGRNSLLLGLQHHMGAFFPATRSGMMLRRRSVAAHMFDPQVHKLAPDAQELDAVCKRLGARLIKSRERVDRISYESDVLNAPGLRQAGEIDAKQLLEIDLARLGGLFLLVGGVFARLLRRSGGFAQAASSKG